MTTRRELTDAERKGIASRCTNKLSTHRADAKPAPAQPFPDVVRSILDITRCDEASAKALVHKLIADGVLNLGKDWTVKPAPKISDPSTWDEGTRKAHGLPTHTPAPPELSEGARRAQQAQMDVDGHGPWILGGDNAAPPSDYPQVATSPFRVPAPPLTAEEAAREYLAQAHPDLKEVMVAELAAIIQRAIEAETASLREQLEADQKAHEQIADYLLPLVGTGDGTSVNAAKKAAEEIKRLREQLAEAEKVGKK
jgi:hypothetical protein